LIISLFSSGKKIFLTRKLHKDFEKLFRQHRILVLENFSKSSKYMIYG